MNVHEIKCLRSLVVVSRMDSVRNEEVSRRAGIEREFKQGCHTNTKIKFKDISRTKSKYQLHNFEVFSYDLFV